MAKVLLVIGDGAEVIDTMVPLYRLAEDFEVVKAAPARRTYHLVQHHHDPDWDITVETPGYTLDSDVAFRDVNPAEYCGLVLPGGRAPNSCDTIRTSFALRSTFSNTINRSPRSAMESRFWPRPM